MGRLQIDLLPEPWEGWQAEFDRLMRDPYLQRKYDRQRRLTEKHDYIARCCAEITTQSLQGRIIDVGPGPGEWLEICRLFNRDIMGVDAAGGDGGMGTGYVQLSKLMHQRQQIPCLYLGWQVCVEQLHQAEPDELGGPVASFNFQGSWEQCYAEHLDGPPHHLHHEAQQQTWRWEPPLRDAWIEAFEGMKKHLSPGGIILNWANGVGGDGAAARYNDEICRVAECCGLKLIKRYGNLHHKWRKS